MGTTQPQRGGEAAAPVAGESGAQRRIDLRFSRIGINLKEGSIGVFHICLIELDPASQHQCPVAEPALILSKRTCFHDLSVLPGIVGEYLTGHRTGENFAAAGAFGFFHAHIQPGKQLCHTFLKSGFAASANIARVGRSFSIHRPGVQRFQAIVHKVVNQRGINACVDFLQGRGIKADLMFGLQLPGIVGAQVHG